MDPPAKSPQPLIARSSESADSSSARLRERRAATEPPADVDPESLLSEIREHLGRLHYRTAQNLARTAADRFPGHRELQKMHRALNRRTGRTHPASGRDTTAEFEWLRNPPASARGKWVALIGREAIAMADTLKEVMTSLKSMKLTETPLIHHID